MISAIISIALILIGLSLLRDCRRKKRHASRVELIFGITALVSGAFFLALLSGSKIMDLLNREPEKTRNKSQEKQIVAPAETALEKRIKYLQKYVPPESLADADPRFSTYAGTASSPRLPLVFPYELRMDPEDGTAILGIHTGEAPVDRPNSFKPLINGIEKANFNNRCLVAKMTANDDKKDDENTPKGEYLLFIFSSATITRFETEQKLWDEADDAGFDIEEIMYAPKILREHYFEDVIDSI